MLKALSRLGLVAFQKYDYIFLKFKAEFCPDLAQYGILKFCHINQRMNVNLRESVQIDTKLSHFMIFTFHLSLELILELTSKKEAT